MSVCVCVCVSEWENTVVENNRKLTDSAAWWRAGFLGVDLLRIIEDDIHVLVKALARIVKDRHKNTHLPTVDKTKLPE